MESEMMMMHAAEMLGRELKEQQERRGLSPNEPNKFKHLYEDGSSQASRIVSQMFLVYSRCTSRCSAPSSYAKQLHQKISSTKQRLQAALTVNPFLIKIPAVFSFLLCITPREILHSFFRC
ncbi:hypothetical protein C4D60_Mb10t17900 [Musa balbisiana]|uniref:Uncharacterized protein n=1 Tax=Musa balbisiana TaxID=52838 RepID=A0A4V4H4W5_MUSBA|nr:hypothetical protein C4D60_Mb10t17900 [Musa balbisiana]